MTRTRGAPVVSPPTVVVIGGGPAGSSAALAAATTGVHTILLERGGPHRDKACGDALVHEALSELRASGVVDPSRLGGRTVDYVRFEASAGRCWDELMTGGCWMVPRRILDQTLRDRAAAAGVDVRYHARAGQLCVAGRGGLQIRVVLHTREHVVLRADAVVLAHGAATRTSASWGIDGNPTRAAAVTRYEPDSGRDNLCFQFDAAAHGPGYHWDFPAMSGTRNTGVFSLSRSDLRRNIEILSNSAGSHKDATAQWRGGYEPLWSGDGRVWHHDFGMISCGDAAGVVDPLTGEGMGPALLTGSVGGRAAAMFAQGDRRQLHHYSDWLAEWASARYQLRRDRVTWAHLVGV
ncbi:NAD(P)/FAD-dependent oxidoreductase [Amycolatopsis sp. H20-H5]|uniref:NAD(P)/FAD-dependent oxidoreductase n=1 Tax=Amycolatopsis sp. H20-H5 TaxID=3046309 RepID=UPI003FA38388